MKNAKRAASLLFAVLMLATLLAGCGTTSGGTTASPSPASSPSPSEVSPSAALASDSASAPVSEEPSADTPDTVGYLTDKFDHFSREKLKIAYLANDLSWAWNKAISDTFEDLADVLNYEYIAYSANGDQNNYLLQLQVLADQGVQGFITGVDNAIAPRVFEICTELKIPFIAESTPFLNEQGQDIWLSVQQDQYNNGAMCVEWLAANYKNYWKDEFETKDLGLLVLNFSVISGITEREPGCKDAFLKAFPEAAANYYVGDLVSIENGFSMQGGNTMTSSIIAGHPEVKKWFVVGLVDDWSMGAARAVESMGKTADVLVTSVQADAFINEMKTGNLDSIYCAACAVSSAEFAVNMACNLVTILEGRATAETIWPEWIADNGSKYASMKIKGSMITKDTYQEFIDTHTVEALVADAKNG
jgi:ABC-type sugar transport system substrate-binding protein